MKVEIELGSCDECPFNREGQGQGAGYDYCSHPEAPPGYGNVIDDMTVVNGEGFPMWCPFLNSKTLLNEARGEP